MDDLSEAIQDANDFQDAMATTDINPELDNDSLERELAELLALDKITLQHTNAQSKVAAETRERLSNDIEQLSEFKEAIRKPSPVREPLPG